VALTDHFVDLGSGELIQELDPVDTWLRPEIASGSSPPAADVFAKADQAEQVPHLCSAAGNQAAGAIGGDPAAQVSVHVDAARSTASDSDSQTMVRESADTSTESAKSGTARTNGDVDRSTLAEETDRLDLPAGVAGRLEAPVDCVDSQTQLWTTGEPVVPDERRSSQGVWCTQRSQSAAFFIGKAVFLHGYGFKKRPPPVRLD
jgi:hypothetical protein